MNFYIFFPSLVKSEIIRLEFIIFWANFKNNMLLFRYAGFSCLSLLLFVFSQIVVTTKNLNELFHQIIIKCRLMGLPSSEQFVDDAGLSQSRFSPIQWLCISTKFCIYRMAHMDAKCSKYCPLNASKQIEGQALTNLMCVFDSRPDHLL